MKLVKMMENLKFYKRYTATDEFGENIHITAQKRELYHYESPVHWHNYFEIEFILDGAAAYMQNGKEYTAEEGHIHLLTPVDFHSFKAEGNLTLINISFDEEMLTDRMLSLLTDKNFKKIHKAQKSDFDRLIKACELLIHECETDGRCKSQLCEYILFSFFALNSNKFISDTDTSELKGIGKALFYLELHFREDISLKKLSDISGFNTTYFSELFRTVTGENFTERLSTLRINYAKSLLKKGFSVTDACFSSGFGSLSNFLSVFKKKCGITPSEYRKKL